MYVVHVKYLQEEKIGMKKTLAIILMVLCMFSVFAQGQTEAPAAPAPAQTAPAETPAPPGLSACPPGSRFPVLETQKPPGSPAHGRFESVPCG